jgi:hypothetical protein
MNFTELYQRIRSIDEGTAPEPTAPGGVIKTKNADGTFSYKPKVPGERLSATLPGNQAAKTSDKTDDTKKQPTPANESIEECGPMGMMGRSSPQGQQDSVTMNISMNGSGSGGIRDLMNILRDLEDGPGDGGQGMDDEMGVIIDKMAGDDGDREMPLIGMDEAEAGGFDQASTTPDETYQDTEYMTKDLAGGINGPKTMYKHSYRQGDNPMAMETLTNRLSNLYQEVKSR